MWTARRIITVIMGVVALLLIARGVWGGVYPFSVQLIAGVFLLILAVLRWRYVN